MWFTVHQILKKNTVAGPKESGSTGIQTFSRHGIKYIKSYNHGCQFHARLFCNRLTIQIIVIIDIIIVYPDIKKCKEQPSRIHE